MSGTSLGSNLAVAFIVKYPSLNMNEFNRSLLSVFVGSTIILYKLLHREMD